MKAKVMFVASLLALCSASTASADLAFPGQPYRPPSRPPIEQPVEQPAPTLEVTAEPEEEGGRLLFHFGFPDVGTYEYRVKDLKTGEILHTSAGSYNESGAGTVTVEFPYATPEEGDDLFYEVSVHFAIAHREPTAFGQKIGTDSEEHDLAREINITKKDDKTEVIVSQDDGWKKIG